MSCCCPYAGEWTGSQDARGFVTRVAKTNAVVIVGLTGIVSLAPIMLLCLPIERVAARFFIAGGKTFVLGARSAASRYHLLTTILAPGVSAMNGLSS